MRTLIPIALALFTVLPALSQPDAEPNDDLASANTVEVNTEIIGTISQVAADNTVDDLDWYVFTLPADGRVRIQLAYAPAGSSFQYSLFGSDDLNHNIMRTETNLPDSSARELWLAAGVYYFQINGRGVRGARTYNLFFEHTPAPPVDLDVEPNDVIETASAITLNATHTGHISHVRTDNTPDDVDWYAFTVPSDGQLRVHVSQDPGGFAFQYNLFGEDELSYAILGTETNLPASTVRETWLAPGGYFLQVNGRGQRTGRTYDLMLEHLPAPDSEVDREPNDDAASASSITLNATHTIHVSHIRPDNTPDDSDWCLFTVPDGDVTIRMSYEPAGYALQYQVSPAADPANAVFGTETNLPMFSVRETHLNAGTYLFHVMGRGARVGRTCQFQIEASQSNMRDWILY
ncbi:MAG: hypothetical protein GC154_08730 [bacterium]|nr:hypothetical protein [bacterium]